tara:strand:+ start:729 stop:1022 length:294 start_codon:yes stop_codon:yes gene_type:complete
VNKITLPVKATDNYGNSYWVTLELKEGDKLGWILSIDETPGSWYVKTLQGKDGFSNGRSSGQVAIDFGQKWYCTNIDNILFTAEVILAHEYGHELEA